MQNIFESKKGYIASIHISGSHFTAAVFDQVSRMPVSGTYTRMPVSHKASVSLVTGIWAQWLDGAVSTYKNEIVACCIAVPAAFDPGKKMIFNGDDQLYPAFRKFDLGAFFSANLDISPDNVYLVSPASALLANEQYLSGSLNNRYCASLVVGTDISCASSLMYFAHDLQWEFKKLGVHDANKVLSIQWICHRYHQLTGISILNIEQFMQLCRTSITAKTILKEYLGELVDLMVTELPIDQLHTIYISGDLILAGNMLKSVLLKRNIALDIKLVKPEQMSILSGAILLGFGGYGLLRTLEQKASGINP